MRLQKIPLLKVLRLPWLKARQVGILTGLVAVAMIPIVGKALLQNSPRNIPEFINRLPDANDQAKMRQQQMSQQDFEAANALRNKQVSEQTAKLLKLANDLKVEVDRAGKDTLSLNAIRKADAIEKLAHNIKEKMTVTAATPSTN
jgi:hypothetical protein